MPFFLESHKRYQRWYDFHPHPHPANVDMTQHSELDIVSFIIFGGCVLSIALLYAYIKIYCSTVRQTHSNGPESENLINSNTNKKYGSV